MGSLLIFDLDGTLIDSQQDLVLSTNATRAHLGLPPLAASVVQSYVGNGAATLVRRALGPDASEQQVADALDYFLHFYRMHSLEHTRLYPEVAGSLEQLAAAGHKLAVLTNKPVRISQDILRALAVFPLFMAVYGGDSFPEKKPSAVGIDALRQETNASVAQTWMIGDSAVDIQTARNAGVRACGVSWGFQPEGFAAHAPDVVVDHAHEWLPLFASASEEVAVR